MQQHHHSLPPLASGAETKRHHHHGPPPAAVSMARRLHTQRPGSVEADVMVLTHMREELTKLHREVDDVVQQEHRQRTSLLSDEHHAFLASEKQRHHGLLYVRYLEEQREKERAQSDLTNKVHELFSVSLQQHKEQEAQKRFERLEKKKADAQAVRRAFHVTARRRYVQKLEQQATVLRETTQNMRMERHHNKYAQDVSRKIQTSLRAAELREAELARRREQIVNRALTIHEKKKLVQGVRAQCTSSTAFLKLPPMQQVFDDDVLDFDTKTLMTRHYHSTYFPPHQHHLATAAAGGSIGWRSSGSGRNTAPPTLSESVATATDGGAC